MKEKHLSEYVMAKSFKKCLTKTKNIKQISDFDLVFQEVICRQGIPDFIAITGLKTSKNKMDQIKDITKSSIMSSSQILSLLKHNAPRTTNFLKTRSGLSDITINRLLLELIKKGFIKKLSKGNFLLSPIFFLPGKIEIWAFELKLKNWKRALFQGLQYKAFANKVITVFPKEREKIILANLDKFKQMDIGVMLFDSQSCSFNVLLKPKKNRPSSRWHYFFALSRIAHLKNNHL